MSLTSFKAADSTAGAAPESVSAPGWMIVQAKMRAPRRSSNAFTGVRHVRVIQDFEDDESRHNDSTRHNQALEYSLSRLAQLAVRNGIDRHTVLRMARILVRVQNPNFLYPNMSSDGEDLTAHWVTGGDSVEISVAAGTEIYVRIREDGIVRRCDFVDSIPRQEIELSLSRLTATADLADRDWRRLFTR